MKYIVCIFSFFFLSPVFSQTDLQNAVSQFANLTIFEHSQIGVCVQDAKTGKVLASHQAQQTLIPASSLKVLTTAAALKILGTDFRFKTELQYDGSISNDGVLNGNLFIKGFGDPTLATNDLDAAKSLEEVLQVWEKAIQEAGIRQINGYIVGDASFFDTAVNGRTWLWEDLGNYYASGSWGLNFHDNRYYLSFQQQAQLGAKPKMLEIEPKIPGLLLINELKSAPKGTGDQAYIFGSPFGYTRFIRGTLPIGNREMTIKGGIPDPPAFTAQLLRNHLLKKGIEVNKTAVSLLEMRLNQSAFGEQKRSILQTLYSPPVLDIVQIANEKSINLYCESLLKMIAWKEKQEASYENGVEVLLGFWQKQGLQTKGLFLQDGSGLSVRNGITANQLASILSIVSRDEEWYNAFATSLPLAGKTGTLKRLFKGSPVQGKLRAKSGGMSRVRSYTGYVPGTDGQLRTFSIITNNFTVKSSVVRNEMVKLMEKIGQ